MNKILALIAILLATPAVAQSRIGVDTTPSKELERCELYLTTPMCDILLSPKGKRCMEALLPVYSVWGQATKECLSRLALEEDLR